MISDATDSLPQKPNVFLIDMGRTKENTIPCYDHFFSFGLRNLAQILEEIHQKFVTRHAIFLCR